MSEATAALLGPGDAHQSDRAESDLDDPDLGAAALADDATGGGGGAGGSEEGDGVETWPDDDEEEESNSPPEGARKKRVASTNLEAEASKKGKYSLADNSVWDVDNIPERRSRDKPQAKS